MPSAVIDGLARGAREQDWPPLPEWEHRPLHRAVLGALGPVDGLRLLDVGCGVGLLLRSAEGRGALVAGVDSAVESLEIARWALPDVDLRVGDAAAVPFPDDTFDVVTASTAVPPGGRDRVAVLGELARVTRPGGRVAVGGWVHPAGCWAQEFGSRLHRLTPGGAVAAAPGAEPGLGRDLSAAGLTVLGVGEVDCPTEYPTRGAMWAAMLGSEQLLQAIGFAGERAVHDAFLASVEPVVAADGSVRVSKAFRFAVAAVV
jgi:SAM-dependent methyltransferase